MEMSLEEAKNHLLVYYDQYNYKEVTEGAVSIDMLPLVSATRTKKAHEEFFHIVRNVSAADQNSIRSAFRDGQFNVAALPACVRPADALGEACHLQIVMCCPAGDSCDVIKFYHSKVDIPWGLVRTLCENEPKVIDYGIASNSNLVKIAFLHLLSLMPGHHWMRQGLRAKSVRVAKNVGEGDRSWNPGEDDLRAGIAFINANAPLSNANNEQYLWVLVSVRDPGSTIYQWPEHVVLKACTNRTTGNSQVEPEWFFPFS